MTIGSVFFYYSTSYSIGEWLYSPKWGVLIPYIDGSRAVCRVSPNCSFPQISETH